MMLPLETERLLLRPFEPSDITAVMDFWGDENVMKYCGGASTQEKLERSMQYYSRQAESGISVFAVVLKESNNVIGACGFNPCENEGKVELICHLAEKYWGYGYATEAASACMKNAASHPRIEIITASADPGNKASQKVMAKLGFSYKGMKWFYDTGREEPYYEIILK